MTVTAVNWSNITSLSQLPAAANTASDGTFWAGMLIMIWIIMILLMIQWGFEISLLVSSFACMVIGFLMVYAGILNWRILMIFLGVLLLMFLYITWVSSRNQR